MIDAFWAWHELKLRLLLGMLDFGLFVWGLPAILLFALSMAAGSKLTQVGGGRAAYSWGAQACYGVGVLALAFAALTILIGVFWPLWRAFFP